MSADPLEKPQPPFKVERIKVELGRVRCLVKLAANAPRNTSAHIMSKVLEAAPELPDHTCVNSHGPTFAAIMNNTSLPHLFEHLVIDAQVHDPATKPEQIFTGTTEWTNASHEEAQVEVNFYDDLVALRAIKSAEALLQTIIEA